MYPVNHQELFERFLEVSAAGIRDEAPVSKEEEEKMLEELRQWAQKYARQKRLIFSKKI